MKKILIIPPHPGSDKIKVRLIEIAKFLTKKYNVYLVNWEAALNGCFLSSRILCFIKDIFKKKRLYKDSNLTIVEFPMLHRPLKLAPTFNTLWLENFFKKGKICSNKDY